MSSEMIAGLFGLLGVFVGGLISWWLQKDRASTDLEIALEAVKTEHMAEKTAQHFLSHKGYTDRSFNLLRERLGGFEDDELRRILVRAGAIRYTRSNGDEYWRLLSREPEAIAHAKEKGERTESAEDDH
jgi:hypothetical protein